MDDRVPTSAGLSSFNLLDEQLFFKNISPQPGMQVLDLGCGLGNYAIAAAPLVGPQGMIYALDAWDEGIETLSVRAEMGGHANIRPGLWQTGIPLPIETESIDLCLLATVTHILVREGELDKVLPEVHRVLKPGGIVAVVEFYKKEGPPGPPFDWRLEPEEVTSLFASHGCRHQKTVATGPHNYLALFSLS